MKKINNLIKSILVLGLIFLSSCETTELDITGNPNALTPDQASADFFMNSIQEDFARIVERFGRTGGQVVRIDYMSGRNYQEAYSPATFNSRWRDSYKGMMEDIRVMNILAEEANLSRHIGMGQVFQAYTMMTLVDFFGDVPYTEALNGSENLNPKADDAESIYKAAIDLLDAAIVNFTGESAANPQYDFFYKKDWDKWVKVANSIKMKAYLTTRLVDGDAVNKFNTIVTDGNYIKDTADDFQFTWGKNEVAPDTRHPRYSNSYTSTGGERYMSNWLMNEMLSTNDPRRFYYFYRQVPATPGNGSPADEETLGCSLTLVPQHYAGFTYCNLPNGYWGRDHGNDEGIPPDGFLRTLAGVYPAGGAFDDASFKSKKNGDGRGGDGITPILLASWTDFMIAELKMIAGDTDGAKTAMMDGIAKSIAKSSSFAESNDANEAAKITSYLTNIAAAYDAAGDKMEILASQYFIALYGNGIDGYNFYRRTGYPKNLQPNLEPDPGAFIRLFLYPSNYANTNSNATQRSTVTDQVFWDINPASPGFPSAN